MYATFYLINSKSSFDEASIRGTTFTKLAVFLINKFEAKHLLIITTLYFLLVNFVQMNFFFTAVICFLNATATIHLFVSVVLPSMLF